ncbi:hypothetical protein PILCRDRAFT_814782, partial [Piloderma croceum F 1598]
MSVEEMPCCCIYDRLTEEPLETFRMIVEARKMFHVAKEVEEMIYAATLTWEFLHTT